MLALLVGLSLILLTVYFGESAGGGLHAIQRGFLQVVSPVQEGASRALKPVRDLAGWTSDTLHAKKDVKRLRRERDYWRRQAIGAVAATRENRQLRSLVALSDGELAGMRPVTARVIGRSPNLWFTTITIDKGSSSGISVDQPVVNGQGLVGKVTAVTGGSAVVTLITDHTSGVSAKINESGVTGVVQAAVGDPNDLLLDFVSKTTRVRKGQQVVTAGSRSTRLESLFPPNLPVGAVVRVEQQELKLYQRVHIRPYADLRRLEFVQVLTGPLTGTASGERAQVP